jgi:hypothetical protein
MEMIVLFLFFAFYPFFVTGNIDDPSRRLRSWTRLRVPFKIKGPVRIASSLFDLQNLPINFFIGLFEASFQFGRNRALQVRSPVMGILRIPQS